MALESWQLQAIQDAAARGYCKPPFCGGSLRPWAPLIVPPQIDIHVVRHLTKALFAINCDYLREHPETPQLFASGAFFAPEPLGQEQWLSIPWCIERIKLGMGIDCEDIACWRAAELRMRHLESAEPYAEERKKVNDKGEEGTVYHIMVARGKLAPNGKRAIEDTSRILMNPLGVGPKLFVDPRWRGNPTAAGNFMELFWDTEGPSNG